MNEAISILLAGFVVTLLYDHYREGWKAREWRRELRRKRMQSK